MINFIVPRILVVALIISSTFTGTAQAQGRQLSVLRDAEIEGIIREIVDPILIAAELNPENVDTYLLNESDINAFVMGGQNIFFNSGLILEAQNANQFIGVIAHETAHIGLDHLSRHGEGVAQMANYSILGMLLGAAAMAAGSADAGMAIMMGGQHVGIRRYLTFSRNQESSADDAAIKYLEATGQSPRGLMEFFEILGDQDLVPEKYQDPYARTHPITSIRIERVRDRIQESPYYDTQTDPEIEAKFKLLQAKLFGYLKPLHATLVRYPVEDKGTLARYARTFAYQQAHKTDKAIEEIDSLIAEYPDNPFFYETKGQILFEDGLVEDAIEPYRMAVELLPSSSLLQMSYARTLISLEEDQYLEDAIKSLEIALREEPNNGFGWKQAAIAYHRLDDPAMTHYSNAQNLLLMGDVRGAMVNAKKAVDLLPEDSPKWIKAQDIMMASQTGMEMLEKQREERREREKKERQKERNRS